jgi:hypothetical protein
VAMAMSSAMEPMLAMAEAEAEAHDGGPVTLAPAVAEDACPMGQDHCTRTSGAVPAPAAALPALTDTPSAVPAAPLWAHRFGEPPQSGPDPPPDLHRLCVSRT